MNNYTYEKRWNVYEKAIAKLDVDTQITVAIEKMSEAIKELCEIKRGIGDREHLAEKIADATIMLEQLRIIFNINSAVCDEMDKKLMRAESWIRSFCGWTGAKNKLPETEDAVPVVRCRDCLYMEKVYDGIYCSIWKDYSRKDGFCHHGKQKEGDDNETD